MLSLPSLQAASYGRLELGKPESDRDVIISFAVQDQKPERKEYDSVHQLKTVLFNALLNTNWRLMSAGLSYRLGLLSGRLRGIAGEERLKEMVLQDLKKEGGSIKRAGIIID